VTVELGWQVDGTYFMKAIALKGIKQVGVIEMSRPEIEKETDVLLKVEMVGVCGSDMHYYDYGGIGSDTVDYPFVIGHECAGTVVEVGGTVSKVKVGDRVAVDPGIICHDCDQCRQGRENTCRNMRFLGCPGQMGGCLCEYIVMPEECCFAIGDDVSWESAVLCEPLAIAMYAVRRAGLGENSDVAILGAGPIGLSCLLSAQADKAGGLYVTEKVIERVETARRVGATWVGNPGAEDVVSGILSQRPYGVDVAFECAGEQETLDAAVEVIKPGGKVMVIGIPRVDRISFVAEKMRRKEITIVNVRRQNKFTHVAVESVTSGRIKADFMATHRFRFERAQEAFEMVSGYRDGVIKAMIEL